MANALENICHDKRLHIAERKTHQPMSQLVAAAERATPPRGFAAALFAASATGYGLIAESKRASPSKGLIRNDFNPASLARAYQAGGAACISVRTERPYFQGADDHLLAAGQQSGDVSSRRH